MNQSLQCCNNTCFVGETESGSNEFIVPVVTNIPYEDVNHR